MSDPILINGNLHSWGSIRLRLGEEIYYGLTGLTYGDSRERVKAYGMGRAQAPRGRSRGKYATDAVKLTGWKGSIQEIIEALADKAPDGLSYGDTVFEIVAQYNEEGDKPIITEIIECVVTKFTESAEEGADPLKSELEIDCMKILRNGLSLAAAEL